MDASSAINRQSPRDCPVERPIGFQSWRDLLFLHWEVPLETLTPLIPRGLTVDLFQGRAYLGVVPFCMRNIRPAWLPRRCALNFLETNVRTYVICNGQPGVFFFSLDADSRLAVAVARRQWGLPYFPATMRTSRVEDRTLYSSHRAASRATPEAGLSVEYTVGAAIDRVPADSLAFFLLERYYLFVLRRGRWWRGQVHHPPYPAFRAHPIDLHCTLVEAAGLPPTCRPPDEAHFSPGVDVRVFRPCAIDDAKTASLRPDTTAVS